MDGLKARLSFDAVAYDYDDEYLTIDTDTHTININNVSRLFGVQYDGNSKLIKFRIRNKLSDIQKMQDSIVYINWIDSKGVKGQSIAINKTINNDTCEFAWKVPFDALKNSGVLHFAMSAVITENNSSVINQKWSTQIASVTTPDGIYIKSYTPSSEEEDRIAQIYNELTKMINTQSENLQAQVNSLNDGLLEVDAGIDKFYDDNYEIIDLVKEARYEGYGWDEDPMVRKPYDYMKCIEIPVTSDNLYSFNLQIGQNWKGINFVDENNKIIKSYLKQIEWKNYYDYRVRAPIGAVKALVNSNINGPLSVYNLDYRKYKYILPNYYVSHLSDKIEEINNTMGKDEGEDYYSVGYIFVTDIHAPANTWTFLPLTERIKALTNAKMMINCGDNVRALGTKKDLISDLRKVMNKTYSVFGEKMMYVLGNHDFIISNSDTWGVNTEQIAKALNYQINLSPLGVLTRKHYYYRDDDVGMIRNIILDYLDVDKKWFIEWLRDTIKSTPTDYHLAFYMHWNIFEQNGNISDTKYQYIVDWLSAIQGKTLFSKTITTTFGNVEINEDYTDTSLAICYFACGHQHKDYMHKVNGVTYFVSDCCANYNDNGVVERIDGTTTDTAFDVICTNVKKRSVNLIRVGAGSNRNWTY